MQRLAMVEEATSMGAAIAGGVGVGLFKDCAIAERLTPVVDEVLPDPQAAAVYHRLYRVFDHAYQALLPVYDELAA
jgi:xylulokinase